jgi:hypothetical protein
LPPFIDLDGIGGKNGGRWAGELHPHLFAGGRDRRQNGKIGVDCRVERIQQAGPTCFKLTKLTQHDKIASRRNISSHRFGCGEHAAFIKMVSRRARSEILEESKTVRQCKCFAGILRYKPGRQNHGFLRGHPLHERTSPTDQPTPGTYPGPSRSVPLESQRSFSPDCACRLCVFCRYLSAAWAILEPLSLGSAPRPASPVTSPPSLGPSRTLLSGLESQPEPGLGAPFVLANPH